VRNLVDRTVTHFGRLDAAVQSENERNKAMGGQFFRAGIQRATSRPSPAFRSRTENSERLRFPIEPNEDDRMIEKAPDSASPGIVGLGNSPAAGGSSSGAGRVS